MANKKKDDGTENIKNTCGCVLALSVIIIVGTIISIIFQLVAVVIPAIVLIVFLVNWYKYKHEDKFRRMLRFKFTEDDRDQFKQLYNNICWAKDKKQRVADEVNRKGIHINQNGRISARSYYGQELQGALDNANNLLDESLPQYNYMSKLPRKWWKTSRNHFTKAIGWGMAIFVWAVYMLAASESIGRDFSNYFSNIGDTASGGFGMVANLWSTIIFGNEPDSTKVEAIKISPSDNDTSDNGTDATPPTETKNTGEYYFPYVLWTAFFLMLVTFPVAWIVGIIIFVIKYRRPPELTINNVDDYCVQSESAQ